MGLELGVGWDCGKKEKRKKEEEERNGRGVRGESGAW